MLYPLFTCPKPSWLNKLVAVLKDLETCVLQAASGLAEGVVRFSTLHNCAE